MTVHTVTGLEELRALGPELHALLARTSYCNLPFLRNEWLTEWWRHFANSGRLSKDSLHAFVVRDSQGELVGFLPMMLTQRPPIGPIRARTLRFLGADSNISELRLAVIVDDLAAQVGRTIAYHLRSMDGWDWIQWPGLIRDSPFAAALESELGLEWGAELTAHVLRLPNNWDDFRRRQTRHVKKSLRHCYHSLERDGMTAQLTIAETPEAVLATLPTFLRLHKLRAEAIGMVTHPNTFQTPDSRHFLADVLANLAETGIAKIFTLSVGSELVASRVVFRLPDCVYLYYSGFDPNWSKYSVATTIVAEAIKYAIGQGISTLHLSTGRDSSKTRWLPEEILFQEAITMRQTAFSRLAVGAYKLARRLSKALAQLVVMVGCGVWMSTAVMAVSST